MYREQPRTLLTALGVKTLTVQMKAFEDLYEGSMLCIVKRRKKGLDPSFQWVKKYKPRKPVLIREFMKFINGEASTFNPKPFIGIAASRAHKGHQVTVIIYGGSKLRVDDYKERKQG